MTTSPSTGVRAERAPVDLATPRRGGDKIFASLTGLAALAVLLQGLWAGLFLQPGGEEAGWVDVHARGGEVAILLAAVATVYAFVRLRPRRHLWVGAALLTVLLVAEAYLGGLIRDEGRDALTAVHVPLAMALMGLAVWLPVRASIARR